MDWYGGRQRYTNNNSGSSPAARSVCCPQTVGLTGPSGPSGEQGPAGPPGAPANSVLSRIASEALGGHRMVRSTGLGTVGYASNDNPLHGDDTQGMTIGSALLGANVNIQTEGSIIFAGWAWAVGEPIFLDTNGLPTQTVPSDLLGAQFIQVIGHAEAANTLYLNIEPPIYF